MADLIHSLIALHTSLIDARTGYEEGVKDAHGKGLAPLFSELIVLHGKDASAIAQQLKTMGVEAGDKGSFMGTFDRVVMKISSLVTELDEKFLPSLINGEERVLAHYDTAIAACAPGNAAYPTLIEQREALRQKIAELKTRKTSAA